MNSTISLGKIAGIRVGVNWSLLVTAWLLSWSLATATLPDSVAGRTQSQYWFAGVLSAVGFLAAILAHEVGHAVGGQAIGDRNGVDHPVDVRGRGTA